MIINNKPTNNTPDTKLEIEITDLDIDEFDSLIKKRELPNKSDNMLCIYLSGLFIITFLGILLVVLITLKKYN